MPVIIAESYQEQIPSLGTVQLGGVNVHTPIYSTTGGPFNDTYLAIQAQSTGNKRIAYELQPTNVFSVSVFISFRDGLLTNETTSCWDRWGNDELAFMGWHLRLVSGLVRFVLVDYSAGNQVLASVHIPWFSYDKWHHLDLRFERKNETHADILVKIDGITIVDQEVTHSFGSKNIIRYEQYGRFGDLPSTRKFAWAHFVLDNEGILHGLCRVRTLRATAQGTQDEWIPTGGFENINNTPPSVDTISGEAQQQTSYAHDALDLGLGVKKIIGVAGKYFASGAGIVGSLSATKDLATHTGTLSKVAYSSSLSSQSWIWQNPFTGLDWTQEDINTTEFGIIAVVSNQHLI
jgi:hypothetical protein